MFLWDSLKKKKGKYLNANSNLTTLGYTVHRYGARQQYMADLPQLAYFDFAFLLINKK